MGTPFGSWFFCTASFASVAPFVYALLHLYPFKPLVVPVATVDTNRADPLRCKGWGTRSIVTATFEAVFKVPQVTLLRISILSRVLL